MFDLNKKTLRIAAPAAGYLMDITQVPDEVFSAKMLGDGFALDPEDATLCAPCAGLVSVTARTHHAVALVANGVEILLHVGLDTVALNGDGFSCHVRVGDHVKAGDPLITIDKKAISARGKSTLTMVVLTNGDTVVKKIKKDLQNRSAVLQVEL